MIDTTLRRQDATRGAPSQDSKRHKSSRHNQPPGTDGIRPRENTHTHTHKKKRESVHSHGHACGRPLLSLSLPSSSSPPPPSPFLSLAPPSTLRLPAPPPAPPRSLPAAGAHGTRRAAMQLTPLAALRPAFMGVVLWPLVRPTAMLPDGGCLGMWAGMMLEGERREEGEDNRGVRRGER